MYKTSIQSLFGLSQPCSTLGCGASDITSILSKMLAPSAIAILAISYPDDDQCNHRSLDTLAHKLIAHGFNKAAETVKNYGPYILFEDLAECMKVLHEFQQDSFAISARLYYNGIEGAKAEAALNAILHPAEKPVLAHAA
jgi:hypothetical protein